ncbi:bifunctional aminotransferase class I/II-fold pyridoxal phosphate-dependent enzyme/GNAT family N-acetyltransferase [Herbiconiux sp. 11R-BC]|uniref:aminotransferase class I/II-fold pyridoxal phosphate-dependent enzyme n=1 Tax=Herbiconiux sp. 11R-BC TaxID=3111637 RepID=UPI003BFD85DB
MPRLASHTDSVPPSGIRRIFELAHSVDDVIYLAVGEPDVPVAGAILDAAAAAWEADDTDYTPNGGIPELRQAIVRTVAERNGIRTDTERVWVTTGATQALYLAMSLVLDPGDEVLLPDPGYTTFTMNAHLLSATPVPYPLHPERDFTPDLAELERLVTARTRAIIVNSPSNPLGAVFDRDTLAALLAFAEAHDLWVISDEVYERFTYDTVHTSLASLGGDDRVLTVFSASKTYALTGARVGWLLTPPGLAPLLRSAQEAMISCVNTPAQRAVVTALTGPQEHVSAAAEHYRDNLERAAAALDERGIRYLDPAGAFYLWVDVSHATGGDVASWAERFLLEQHVAVAPGSAFGRMGEGWIRLCAAASTADLLEGIRRLPAPASAEAAPGAPTGPTAAAASPDSAAEVADAADSVDAPASTIGTRPLSTGPMSSSDGSPADSPAAPAAGSAVATAQPDSSPSPSGIVVRRIRADEIAFASEQRFAAYSADLEISGDYADEVRDVARHVETAEVWVAVEEETGRVLASVTLPRPGETLHLGRPGELEFRLLAVDPDARRRGLGRLLTQFVIDTARERGATRVVMNSGTGMTSAHRLYESMGFARMPERENPPGIEPSRAYGLEL